MTRWTATRYFLRPTARHGSFDSGSKRRLEGLQGSAVSFRFVTFTNGTHTTNRKPQNMRPTAGMRPISKANPRPNMQPARSECAQKIACTLVPVRQSNNISLGLHSTTKGHHERYSFEAD
jgi:hypothetical protein